MIEDASYYPRGEVCQEYRLKALQDGLCLKWTLPGKPWIVKDVNGVEAVNSMRASEAVSCKSARLIGADEALDGC